MEKGNLKKGGFGMIEKYAITIVTCVVAIIAGVILGNSAVYVFNKIPGKWLVDYGKEPDEELLHPTRQRVRSTPWKYCFSCLFVMAAIKLGLENPVYGVIAMITCWLLLEMAIADLKYMIVPDQFIIMLMVAGIGFVPHHINGPMSGIWGAAIGFAVMLVIGVLGKIIYRADTLGGGDIKLFTALGLCLGGEGILAVFVLSTFITALHLGYMMAKKQVKPREKRPLVPYIAIAATIYMVILREMSYNIWIGL